MITCIHYHHTYTYPLASQAPRLIFHIIEKDRVERVPVTKDRSSEICSTRSSRHCCTSGCGMLRRPHPYPGLNNNIFNPCLLCLCFFFCLYACTHFECNILLNIQHQLTTAYHPQVKHVHSSSGSCLIVAVFFLRNAEQEQAMNGRRELSNLGQ